jgi:RNA polymerase sigma-32 factor
MASNDTAFDAFASEEEESRYLAPASYLEDPSADPAAQLEASNWEQESQRRLMSAMEGLDDRSRNILARRWLADEKATLHELAAEYGVSAERIRQLEKNAMKKIRGSILEA